MSCVMNRILAALVWLLVSMPAMAQVWNGEVPDATKVAAMQKAATEGGPAAMADLAFLSRYCRGGVKYDPGLILRNPPPNGLSLRDGSAFQSEGLRA